MDKNSKTVLVTGATGHLGFTLVKELMARNYDVRAGVRNSQNTERNNHLLNLGVEIVDADLMKPETLRKAVEDVDGIFHVAAVFSLSAKDPQKEIIDPSVTGGLNVLKAAKEAGVKRIVWTSSMAAIGMGTTPDKPFTEDDWYHQAKNPYYYAKYKAEWEAWKYAESNNLDLITINPGYIIGPNFYRHTPTTKIFEDILSNSLPMIPPMRFNFVDVRDVALAHILAFEKKEAKGRYICATRILSFKKTLQLLHKMYSKIKVPRFQMSPLLMKIFAIFSKQVTREEARISTETCIYTDTTKIQRELGWKPRPVEESLQQTLQWIQIQQS
ncbi:MAG: NAD-dependent epimerase/dehydratase family protein [Candidatus Hodarchaeales archaeon]|jgi:dihydroflavonol-4-reductase